MTAAASDPTDPGASGDRPQPNPEPMSQAIRSGQDVPGSSRITEAFQILLSQSEVMPNFVKQCDANLLHHRVV